VFVFLLLSQFQIGRLVLWPFIIVTTFIHELGHGITAILLGGNLHKIEIYSNAAGLARFSGISSGRPLAVVALGGLIAPSIAGAIFITSGTSKKASSIVMLCLSIIIIAACVLWVRTLFGFTVLLVFAIAFAFIARGTSSSLHQFIIQFMGVHMIIDTCTRTLRYLFSKATTIDGQLQHSDTGVIASNLGSSHFVWALIIATFSIGLLAFSLHQAYFRKL